jgi:tetratricopeptide (TPR) repeat protein
MLDGDYAAAAQAAGRAVEAEPGNHLGYSLLGQALIAQGRVDAGLAQLRRGVEIGGDGVEPRLALARELIRTDRLDEAAVEYRKVLIYAPDSPNALGNLATIYGRTGQDEEAVPLLRRALAVQPSYRDANNLGVLLFYAGRLEEAIAAFRQAHELSPDRPAPLVGLGDSYRELGDVEAGERWLRLAIEKYDLALDAGGPRAQLLGGRAVCAAKLGLFDRARQDLDEALALEPTTSSLLFAAARVHALAADADACYDYVARALAAGFPRAEFHREPDFRALRADPRFRELLESWPPAS